MNSHLIPVALPFTADELREAARRLMPPRQLDEFVEHVAKRAAESVERQNARATAMRRAGQEPSPPVLDIDIPEAIFACLTVVSPDTATRVAALKEREWREKLESEIAYERRWSAERAGLIPTLDDILDDAERRGDFSWDDPLVYEGMAASGLRRPEPPPATPELIARAEARIAELKARWETLVAAARCGAPMPAPEPRTIWDDNETMPEGALPGVDPDWEFIDHFIDRKDRDRQGERHLFVALVRDLPRFNGELVRALRIDPRRAVPRAIMTQLVEGHVGWLAANAPVAKALQEALGEDAPRQTTGRGEEYYEPADLLEWFEINRALFEHSPLFDDWRARTGTRREISFMRLQRDKHDELFPGDDSDDSWLQSQGLLGTRPHRDESLE